MSMWIGVRVRVISCNGTTLRTIKEREIGKERNEEEEED